MSMFFNMCNNIFVRVEKRVAIDLKDTVWLCSIMGEKERCHWATGIVLMRHDHDRRWGPSRFAIV